MGERRDSESEDGKLIWQMVLAAIVVVAAGLAWPDRYKPPYPWRDPVFDAVLWSSLFVIICKPLLKQWRFWISLAFGIAAQVWTTKALIVSGVRMRPRTGKLMALIGVIVWGVSYVLLTRIHRGLGFEESTAGDEQDAEL